MAPRPYWKGYLKLSLVSCPIALYPAIDASERVSFRQVNKATGNRLRQQLVDSVTGDVVQSFDKGRGYEVGENQFVVVEDEELERAREAARAPSTSEPVVRGVRERAVEQPVRKPTPREELLGKPAPVIPPPRPRLENTRTIEIERFVPRAQIDPSYHHTPYYIAPRDLVGQEAFAVIRDAMAGKEVVGMGRVVLSNRERPIMLEPSGKGLRGITLRYAHELRSADEYFADIPELLLPDEMVSVAEHIVETKTANFDPAYLEDRYRSALVPMLRQKRAEAGVANPAGPAAPPRQNVVNLMAALKQSLAAERPARGVSKPTPRRTAAADNRSPAKRSSVPVKRR
jgi:DNA end-binding protein Ku